MRKIKFRVWLKKQKIMRDNVSFHAGNIWTGYCWIPFNANYELMEYTGCEDKNGVEIFEGDIVKRAVLYKGEILESINYVEFENGCFILKNSSLNNYLFLSKEYENEVIGNIYENPELLEEL